jgi:DNA-binding SARP family transcriptional activator
MNEISVKMFGIPGIKKDGAIINFPFKKAEALFYYLMIKRKSTRDELVGLLWSDSSEKAAKGNLRNALYVIRKSFDMNIIKPNQSQIITIDEKVNISTDVNIFMKNQNDIENYSGEFLENFFVKDCEEYEQWLLNQRELYSKIYIDRLYAKIDSVYPSNKTVAEEYCKLLIESDRFDEKPYRLLMEIYRDNRQFNKAIYLYQQLDKTLKEELYIQPSKDTREIYNRIVKLKELEDNDAYMPPMDFFYGREPEVDYLLKNYQSFMMDELYNSILITGEAGIGKTKLVNRFLKLIDVSQVYLFQVDCYYDERNCCLKPWNIIIKNIFNIIDMEDKNVFIPSLWKNNVVHAFPFLGSKNDYIEMNSIEKINDINYQVLEEALSNILNVLSNNKKIIIIFEDMQWIDATSLNLLRRILLNDLENNILFLGTSRNEYNYELDKFVTLLSRYNKIDRLKLNRFNRNEVFEFLDMYLSNYNFNEKEKERIFKETEGNTYFMVEILNGIKENADFDFTTAKIDDVIKTRFLNITGEKREVLNVISLFFDGIKIDLLKEITNLDEFKLINIIEELEKQNIIEEKLIGNELIFKFTHKMLRKYIYDNLSMIRKKALHEKAGQALEKGLTGRQIDILLYPKIIYNYLRSRNQFKYIEYTIKNVNIYLEYNLDLFPKCSVADFEEDDDIACLKDQEIIPYLGKLQEMTNTLEIKGHSMDEILSLKIMLDLMKGRYLISVGQYDEGVSSIKRVIEGAKEIKDYRILLMGYRQMIYYCIQVNNAEVMENIIIAALKVCDNIGFDSEKAALLRFKALNRMMYSDYDGAHKLLMDSINLFEMLNQRQNIYSVNIAAAYNYMGEIYRINQKFEEAINYYDNAISICIKKGIIRGLTIFYTNAGRCAMDNNDYEKGERYLKEALFFYNKTNTLIGRAIAESLMALIKINKKCYDEGLQLLFDSGKHVHIQNKAYELAVYNKVQAIIKYKMKDDMELENTFSTYLNQSMNYYKIEAIRYFEKVNEVYEIEKLKKLK